ncbi:MAG: acyl-CoA thioesterase [Bacteroidia bacterium]|nr:acyl-CoA thioesterase [Bacteroidia bacterium]
MPLIARLPLQIRFSDVDSLGHVNNAFYLSYFELARMEFFKLSGLKINWHKIGIIIARVEIDYLRPLLLYNSAEVICKAGITGNKSFELLYELTAQNKEDNAEIVCKGKSTQVCFDYELNKSVLIPEDWKQVLLS